MFRPTCRPSSGVSTKITSDGLVTVFPLCWNTWWWPAYRPKHVVWYYKVILTLKEKWLRLVANDWIWSHAQQDAESKNSQLYLDGWVDPVPDPLLLRKSGSAGNRIQTSGSVARNSDHYTTETVCYSLVIVLIKPQRKKGFDTKINLISNHIKQYLLLLVY
jgi:hypothetical protein